MEQREQFEVSEKEHQTKHLGIFMREARQSKGISLTNLARRLKHTKSHLSNVENGLARPSKELIEEYEGALQLQPGELLRQWGNNDDKLKSRPRSSELQNNMADLLKTPVDSLIEGLKDPSPDVRIAIAEALSENDQAKAVIALNEILVQDDDIQVRVAAARALGKLSRKRQYPKLELRSQYLILLVDDDRDLLPSLVETLTTLTNFKVITAHDGIDGLEKSIEFQPDCIVIDIRMPGVDGYQLARILRGDPATAKIPIVFLSALKQDRDRLAGFLSGGDDYLVKPVKPTQFISAITKAISTTHAISESLSAIRLGTSD